MVDNVTNLVDEPFPIPPEVYTDRSGEFRWDQQEELLRRYANRGNVAVLL